MPKPLIALDIPACILRVARALCVVRILHRLKSVNNIADALVASFVPVANAFLLMPLVVSICEPPAPARSRTHSATRPTGPALGAPGH